MSIQLIAKLDKVRREIVADPRWAPILSLLMARDDVIDTRVPTAATDGTIHYWNPDFVNEHPHELLKFVKLHELGHDWLYHSSGRAKDLRERYPAEVVALAIDHAVNNFLVDCGLTAPQEAVCDRKYQGQSAEEIAYDLMKNAQQAQPQGGDGDGEGSGGCQGTLDDHGPMINATPEQIAKAKQASEKAQADAEIMEGVTKLAGLDTSGDEHSSGQGSEYMGAMLQAARDARHKARDWRDELDEFTGSVKDAEWRSTYSKLCRRPVEGVIRRGRVRDGKPHIGVIIDTSGSMYSDLPKVLVELEVLSSDGYTFDVICTDGEVYGPYHFTAGDFDYRDLPLDGGGGSDMVPAFEKYKEHCPDSDAIIFCTDGYIDWPSEEMLESIGAPVLLVQFDSSKSVEGKRFYKHILIRPSHD